MTMLTWYDADGTNCEYADGTTLDPLYDLPTANFYINGRVSEAVFANFTANNLTPPRNTTVIFTDLSTGGVTGWSWSFSPNTVTYVDGTGATSQNPHVQFTNGGLYTVTLVANNAYNNDTETKVNYIRAGIHGLWIGVTSTEWNTSTNWDDHWTPYNLTNVLITTSTSPAYWPKYTGNLLVGIDASAQCKSITFEGTGYMLTIIGGTLTTKPNAGGNTVRAVSGGTGNIKFEP